MMKFAYHCELHDSPYRNYLKYFPYLYDHVDLKVDQVPGLVGKVVPQCYGETTDVLFLWKVLNGNFLFWIIEQEVTSLHIPMKS